MRNGGNVKMHKNKVRFRGKNVKTKKIQRHVSKKPRILGPVVINFTVIFLIIFVVLIIFA